MVKTTHLLKMLVRGFASEFPGGSFTLQVLGDLETDALRTRLDRLEDPIGQIHPDLPSVAPLLYRGLAEAESGWLRLNEADADRFRRVLQALEGRGMVRSKSYIGAGVVTEFRISSPVFVLYLAERHGSQQGIELVIKQVEELERGRSLNGQLLAADTGVPIRVVQAVFERAEAEGLGRNSRTIGELRFTGR